MPPLLIANPLSGDGRLGDLRDSAAARAIPVHRLQEGDDAAEIARGAGADAPAMAGGDGSLASVAIEFRIAPGGLRLLVPRSPLS